jgi:hypothetical protein
LSGNSGRCRGIVDVVGEKWSKSGKTCCLLGKFLYDHSLLWQIEESEVL